MSREEAGIAAVSGTQLSSDNDSIQDYVLVLSAKIKLNGMPMPGQYCVSIHFQIDCEYELLLEKKKKHFMIF